MENEEEVLPGEDSIDVALLSVVQEIAGEDPSDDDLDDVSDVLFSVAEDMAEDGEIDDIPDNDASDDQKALWLEKSFPALKRKVMDIFSGEQELVPFDGLDGDAVEDSEI